MRRVIIFTAFVFLMSAAVAEASPYLSGARAHRLAVQATRTIDGRVTSGTSNYIVSIRVWDCIRGGRSKFTCQSLTHFDGPYGPFICGYGIRVTALRRLSDGSLIFLPKLVHVAACTYTAKDLPTST